MKFIIISALCTLLLEQLNAQTDTGKFVDFHIHTTFKHYYKDFKSVDDLFEHRNNIDYLRDRYGEKNWQGFTRKQKALRNGKTSNVKNYNQSDFRNLVNTPGSIFCTSIYPYEKQFALSFLKMAISNLFVSGIPMRRLKEIGKNSNYPLKEFLCEYAFLQAQRIKDPKSNFAIELARNKDDLIRILSQKNASAQIISIEGGQVLYGPISGQRNRVREGSSTPAELDELQRSVNLLRTLPHKVFFITPSHFTDNRIAGFAKTIDRPGVIRLLLASLSTFRKVRSSFFTKHGEGIHGELDIGMFDTDTCHLVTNRIPQPYTRNDPAFRDTPENLRQGVGKEIIEQLLKPDSSSSNGILSKRILVDVKHFDIQARFEYYNLIKKLKIKYGKNIPIIAGHVAMSGEKLQVAMATGLNPRFDVYSEVKDPMKFYKKQHDLDRFWHCWTEGLDPVDRIKFFDEGEEVKTSFNPFQGNIVSNTAGWFYPWSINLCDEEVKIIYDSDGIIGLNFDERILGGYMINYNRKYRDSLKEVFNTYIDFPFQTTPSFPLLFREYCEVEPLLRNIFYIVLKSKRPDASAWKKIAIGSDFDGLIDPIDLCATALNIPSLQKKMVTYLELFWEMHKMDSVYEKKDLFFGKTLSYAEAVRSIFFQNGYDFIMRYY